MQVHSEIIIANATGKQVAFATICKSTLPRVKLPEEELKRRRDRLEVAIDKKFDKSFDKLGKLLGYKNGAFLRQMVTGERAVLEKTIAAIERLPGMNGWFAAGPWPFERVPRDLFDSLTEREKGAVEDAMLQKIHAISPTKPDPTPTGRRRTA